MCSPDEEADTLEKLSRPEKSIYLCTRFQTWKSLEQILDQINNKEGEHYIAMETGDCLAILSHLVANEYLCMTGKHFTIQVKLLKSPFLPNRSIILSAWKVNDTKRELKKLGERLIKTIQWW
jgi:hypothetical protein